MNAGSFLFLLLAPDSEEAKQVFEIIKENKGKLDDKLTDNDLDMINSNKELITSYFISSLKTIEREKIIKFLYKYKTDYDKESLDEAIKNLLSYKYNVLVRQSVKSMAKKMLKQWKDKIIMDINNNPDLNNEQLQELVKLIEGLYE